MDIIIFLNTAIPIGEGLLALKYFYWHQSALKKRLLRLNDLEWTLNFFHLGTRVGWPHFYSQWILDGAQNMNVRTQIFSSFYALDKTNSTSFCYILVLHAGKTFPSFQSHESPQKHERTETWLTKCLSYIIIMIIIILILLIINIIINNINNNIYNNNNV